MPRACFACGGRQGCRQDRSDGHYYCSPCWQAWDPGCPVEFPAEIPDLRVRRLGHFDGAWKWHSGVVAQGKVFGMPCQGPSARRERAAKKPAFQKRARTAAVESLDWIS